MNSLILQIIFICGLLFGFITLFAEMKQKSNISKIQLSLSIAIIFICGISLVMAIN